MLSDCSASAGPSCLDTSSTSRAVPPPAVPVVRGSCTMPHKRVHLQQQQQNQQQLQQRPTRSLRLARRCCVSFKVYVQLKASPAAAGESEASPLHSEAALCGFPRPSMASNSMGGTRPYCLQSCTLHAELQLAKPTKAADRPPAGLVKKAKAFFLLLLLLLLLVLVLQQRCLSSVPRGQKTSAVKGRCTPKATNTSHCNEGPSSSSSSTTLHCTANDS